MTPKDFFKVVAQYVERQDIYAQMHNDPSATEDDKQAVLQSLKLLGGIMRNEVKRVREELTKQGKEIFW